MWVSLRGGENGMTFETKYYAVSDYFLWKNQEFFAKYINL